MSDSAGRVLTPAEILAEVEASGWVCDNCNGSGMDRTWHEGAPCAEVHQCGYCMGFTCKPDVTAPARVQPARKGS